MLKQAKKEGRSIPPSIFDLGAGREWENNITSFVMFFQSICVSRKKKKSFYSSVKKYVASTIIKFF